MDRKYIIVLVDGASGRPVKELDGKTSLEAAYKPNLDYLAQHGICGWTKNVPEGMHPGSDVAILSVLGCNPKKYYTGRAPLEAASIGIDLADDDVAYRCNLVRVEDGVMADYSAGHISTEEAREVIQLLNEHLAEDDIKFYPGVSYRHVMVWKGGKDNAHTTPPHDITGKSIKEYLPQGKGSEKLVELMEKSREILKDHAKANMIWLWGQGKKPNLPNFEYIYGVKGGVISAVDLIRGIGILMGLKVINVPGITGYIDTNYKGKAEYALRFLENEGDFVFIHVEAPDEAGHKGDAKAKVQAIEDIDKYIIGPILEWVDINKVNARILVLPDHPTPLDVGTHTSDPVPYVMYSSVLKVKGEEEFSERALEYLKEYTLEEGYRLISLFFGKVCSDCSTCGIKDSCSLK
ncbi:2,3-bisphosphoglycerate-independent phosphoglycerate mutase [Thermosulfidibacter takaii ABI70S6]|uniref:2,3-bisphosphoglycerate-independent phosphoglycerate mutase n=1 Tax=Thermosulfidibacter takaii (strain DSM 17441 / JCM 13301 / NBRC 103674 / ABI70S6) TaxID=1298851 RepID=A0A0S3QTK8_THET7|nr:cofactor-independent phosphoglycerate mutase [Thermosulfidibacter takaii]BAT71628.1 2,3-bisphosphoglycerate-independent phosphoglycerate mutase [Thermosulfidibacter takaii ABI70S6]